MNARMFGLFILHYIIVTSSAVYPRGDEGSESDITLKDLLKVKISTAAKYEQTAGEAPASVSIITAEDIERYGYRTLAEAFQSVRGFYTSYDRNYGYLGVRGFSRPSDYNNRVLILVNGQTINEPFYQSAAIESELPIGMDAIDRIEIVRGPGSTLYGTGAMFAVVNVITKKNDMSEGFGISGESGSYGRLNGSANFLRGFDNGVELVISGQWADIKGQDLYFQEYDDPSTNNGVAKGLDWDKYYKLFTAVNYHNLKLQAMVSAREKGIPTGAYEMPFNNDHPRTLDDHALIQLKYDREISANKNIMLRGYFDHYGYDGTYPYEYEEDEELYVTDFFEENDVFKWGSELQFRWDVRSDNRLTVGTEYQNTTRATLRTWDEWETYFDNDFPFHVVSFYLQDEYEAMENLSLTGGIRWDKYSNTENSLSPRAAIVYHPTESNTLKLLYGEAFRAPSLYEIYFEDPIAGWKPNLGLKAEKIKTTELVWEKQLSTELSGAVSVYSNEMNNLIDTVIDPSDSLLQAQNVSKASARGLELELNARLKSGLHGYANYAYQRTEATDSHQKLTNSPSHLLKVGLSHPVLKHFYAAAEMQYESARITVHDTKTEAFLLTNLKLSSKLLFNHIKSSLLIRNLFDINYATPGGFEHLQPAIKQDGRNFSLRVDYKF